eukprot:COSAG03_NODE_119_length_12315_cov_126.503847_5_plen_89_part_00
MTTLNDIDAVTYHGSDLDFVMVDAFEMTDTQFKYRCFCTKGYHVHGNGGDPFTNRVEYRSSHCPSRNQQSKHLEIHITDRTERKLTKH